MLEACTQLTSEIREDEEERFRETVAQPGGVHGFPEPTLILRKMYVTTDKHFVSTQGWKPLYFFLERLNFTWN